MRSLLLRGWWSEARSNWPTPRRWRQFAIRQVARGVAWRARSNVCDVGSRRNQLVKNVVVERLDHFYSENNEWREVLVEDRHAGPAETAAVRIDFEVWFRSLTPKKQQIARTLARRGHRRGGQKVQFDARSLESVAPRIQAILGHLSKAR